MFKRHLRWVLLFGCTLLVGLVMGMSAARANAGGLRPYRLGDGDGSCYCYQGPYCQSCSLGSPNSTCDWNKCYGN